MEPAATNASIRKGDQVSVITGRYKSKSGRVLAVNPSKRTVTVEHVNMIKRHTRANPAKNVKGGILEKEAPIHVSNVMLFDDKAGKGARIRSEKLQDEKSSKVRVSKKSGEVIPRKTGA